jgi:hypothetical protein
MKYYRAVVGVWVSAPVRIEEVAVPYSIFISYTQLQIRGQKSGCAIFLAPLI